MRTKWMRDEVVRLLRQTPFRPFLLNLENGDRSTIEHPENIAVDPGSVEAPNGSSDFYVLTGRLRFYGSFDAGTSIVLRDTGETISR